jgi:hypothetical protein
MNGLDYAQFYLSGEGFLEVIVSFVYIILNAFSNIYAFFASPVIAPIESLFDNIGFDGVIADKILDLLRNSPLGEITLLGFMFGSGLALYLAITIAKWIIDILP